MVVANRQNAGRGRRGRIWQMEPGTGIACPCFFDRPWSLRTASMLTLVMGLAQAKALDRLFGLSAKIKWPNDLVIADEGQRDAYGDECGDGSDPLCDHRYRYQCKYDLLSRGIKGNGDFSLRGEGMPASRAEIICACMEEFETCYQAFMEARDLRLLRQDYETYLVNKDRQVCVLDPGRGIYGYCPGN